MLWLERHERFVTSQASRYEDPASFFDSAMRSFDEALIAEPAPQSGGSTMAARVAQFEQQRQQLDAAEVA